MMSYNLLGGENLKAHMGHQIEVLGTMSKQDRDAMDKMHGIDKGKMSDKDMKPMTLNVSPVKMISSTCP